MTTLRSAAYQAHPACIAYEQAKDAVNRRWIDRTDRSALAEQRLRAEIEAELSRLETERDTALSAEGLMVHEFWGEGIGNDYFVELVSVEKVG